MSFYRNRTGHWHGDCFGQSWLAVPGSPGKWAVQGGLIDANGRRTGLTMELQFCAGPHTGKCHYIFTVFNTSGYGTDRVYQLDIRQGLNVTRKSHRWPHEHYGKARTAGADEWARWSYNELLRYFSTRTNIVFRPAPPNPYLVSGAKR
jgi:hypothetical protein